LLRTTGKTSLRLAPGRYRFSVSSVDGVRLLVDGQVAIGAWSSHGPRRDFRDLELDEGLHELRFEAFQKGRRGLLWIRIEPTPPWSADPLRSFERAAGEQERMNCPEARAAEGALMAHAGRFRDALSQYERALELDDSELFFVQQAALINLQLYNVKAYDAACARILNERPPADDRIASARSAVVALMKKGAEVGPGVKEMLKAADPASAPPSQRGMCLLARGLADYRSGSFEGCVRVLEEAAGGRLTPEARATAEVYRAMAMVQLGQARQARELFASVRKSFDSFPMAARVELDGWEVQDLLICQLGIREAGKVFGEP
jgi:tetratricopeptide (TPR) repeat protein